jgi:cupin fold WbuC family metalloprotein
MESSVRLFDSAFLDALCAEAAATPRRRKNFNLHAGADAPCHRFFNAMCADTYVRPHRHAHPSKDETLVLLRGALGVVIFDPGGNVQLARTLLPGMVADVPYDTLHAWVALVDGTVFLETKAGPYAPNAPDEWAAFAPPEGDPRAPAYLAYLKSLCPPPPPTP